MELIKKNTEKHRAVYIGEGHYHKVWHGAPEGWTSKHAQLLEKLRFKEFDAVVSDSGMIDSNFTDLEKAEFPVVLTCSTNWKAPKQENYLGDQTIFHCINSGKISRQSVLRILSNFSK